MGAPASTCGAWVRSWKFAIFRLRIARAMAVFFRALDGVSFHLESSEVLGVLGESGSEKSTLAVSLVGLFRRNSVVAIGVQGQNLLKAEPAELQAIRSESISLIFQAVRCSPSDHPRQPPGPSSIDCPWNGRQKRVGSENTRRS